MTVKELKKHSDWIKMWSGKCSINSCTQMGEEWTASIKVLGKPIYNFPIVFFIRNGITDCWARQEDKDNFGQRLIRSVEKDKKKIKDIANSLKICARKVFSFIKQNSRKKIDLNIYDEFWRIMTEYYQYHLSVKYVSDYIAAGELKKYLPLLQKSRIFTEPVFQRQENFADAIAKQISKDTKMTRELVLCTTKEELRRYFKNSKMPDKALLEERNVQSVLIFELKRYKLFSGHQVENPERMLLPRVGQAILRGVAAYKGKVTGRVRIVLHPSKYKGKFKKGDILVTGMTRPEFSTYYKKAAAIVTDSGGVLSHAAIVAREMKKPCIIGTKIATNILRSGDLVEVDANKSIVKILKT